MKVWNLGKFENIEIGQKVLVARCGSGHTYFGEFAVLSRTTSRHLVFTTDSGAIVKTSIDNLGTIGKAAKAGYWVSLNIEGRENDKNFFKQSVHYWDEKKLCLVNK